MIFTSEEAFQTPEAFARYFSRLSKSGEESLDSRYSKARHTHEFVIDADNLDVHSGLKHCVMGVHILYFVKLRLYVWNFSYALCSINYYETK